MGELILKIFRKFIFIFYSFLYYFEKIKLKKYYLSMNNVNLVFDIGYNKGNYSKALLSIKSSIKIIGVEANNKVLANSYSHKNITKLNSLVSNSKTKSEDFYVNDVFTGASTASINFINNSRLTVGSINIPKNNLMNKNLYKKTKVNTISLDKLISEYGIPDLIKIDVEGYEYSVLKSLSSYSGKITFEWSEEFFDEVNKSITYLKKIGYHHFGVVGYFIEKPNSKIISTLKGDPPEIEPKYYDWNSINLNQYINKNRLINYGMIWAK